MGRRMVNRHSKWRRRFVFLTLLLFLFRHPLASVIDFAGGMTIHTNSGAAALAVALVMGRRRGKGRLFF
jgi:ammonia channel protein AmtB